MCFLQVVLVLAVSTFSKLQAQSLCQGVDLKNAIIEQKVMENIRPFIVELMQTQHQHTMEECVRVCDRKVKQTHNATKHQQEFTLKYENISKRVDENAAIVREMKQTNPDNILLEDFPMHMSESSLNPRTFLSLDRKSLFNSRNPWANLTDGVPVDWPSGGNNTLENYYGVRGSLPLKHPDTVCFEVDAYYSIYFNLTGRNLLFEIGIGRDSAIDNSHYIGWEPDFTWSFVVSRDDVTGRVKSACQSQQKSNDETDVGNSTAGTQHHMELGIRVNMADGTMMVIDRSSLAIICNFTNIDVTKNLWPMFGVYAKSSTDVVVTLRHSFLLSSRTWINL
ncbi:uncharacterized protein LOC110442524 [Mizuhopecten yessoensis]|uniref:Uncharacterized protein n=1 Tax=Mizuhopecten yessoensis TaxID=6573 RepID=A0A210PH14_MIZYE|nr:uncharacterized protein LOC110442524 [Mizuhopecten yessoensis]OWF35784.1 hypothetical protein KP79_PYT05177 [Mizuhopecten yessoensis]